MSLLPRRSVVCALTLAFAVVLLPLPGSAAHASTVDGAPSSAAMLRICTNCASYGISRPAGYRYVVLQSWQASLIPQLRAANPGVKVLAYKNMAATYSYACTNGVDRDYAAGVGYCEAATNHPSWFLTDTTGGRIEFCDYSGLWQMDVGDQSYQDACDANVAADLRARGFDGVEVDDANWSERYHLCGRTIAKYRTDSDYGAATRSFLARVGPALRAQGFLVLPNIALPYFSGDADVWSDWISFTSGAIQEHFSKWGTGTTQQFGDAEWRWRQSFLPLTQSAGKIFVGVAYAPMSDTRSMVYARANFLLDWDGGPSALIFEPSNPEQQDPYSVAWTQDVGVPVGARFQVGSAWRRNYSRGTVVVNPSTTATQTVALGSPFVAADGSTVTSISLAPMTGAILGTSAASVPAPPAVQTPPAITGQERVGKTLTATSGTWAGAPTSYSYAWSSCDTRGMSCNAIAGASARTYTVVAADAGRTIRVSVTAANRGGAASASSAPTGQITGAGATRLLAYVAVVNRSTARDAQRVQRRVLTRRRSANRLVRRHRVR